MLHVKHPGAGSECLSPCLMALVFRLILISCFFPAVCWFLSELFSFHPKTSIGPFNLAVFGSSIGPKVLRSPPDGNVADVAVAVVTKCRDCKGTQSWYLACKESEIPEICYVAGNCSFHFVLSVEFVTLQSWISGFLAPCISIRIIPHQKMNITLQDSPETFDISKRCQKDPSDEHTLIIEYPPHLGLTVCSFLSIVYTCIHSSC